MAEQLTDECINKVPKAFLEHGQITKQKVCSIIECVGLNTETVINSAKEIFDFKGLLTLVNQLKGEECAEEFKKLFTNNGYITRENILSIINSQIHTLQESEIQDIMGTYPLQYSFNSFLSIMTCVHMCEVFKKMDKDGNGYITLHELGNFMEVNSGKIWSFLEVIQKMKKVDLNGDGKISYQEFVRMMINDGNRYEDEMREAFKLFDVDGDGFITKAELKDVLSKDGGNLNDNEINKIVKDADQNGDGKINFEEFIAAIDWNN